MNNCEVCHGPVPTESNMNDNLHDACLAEYARKCEEKTRISKMVSGLIDECNGGRTTDISDAIIHALTHDHRTIQQSFWSAMKLAIVKYGELPAGNYVDGRNEAAHHWCKAVAAMPDSDLRFPLI